MGSTESKSQSADTAASKTADQQVRCCSYNALYAMGFKWMSCRCANGDEYNYLLMRRI